LPFSLHFVKLFLGLFLGLLFLALRGRPDVPNARLGRI